MNKPDPFSLEKPPVKHRSVSQVKTFERCGYAYYLAKRLRAWEIPAAWLPMGTAVHSAAEAWEKSGRTMSLEEAQRLYRQSYVDSVNTMLSDTPNMTYWFASGPYHGEADIARRYTVGEEHVARYIKWFTGKGAGDAIWITPDGKPAIELEFDIDLDGVQVKGFIDNVLAQSGPWDIKTGAEPGDVFQLATYDVALETMYGERFGTGGYLMTKKVNIPTKPYDLTIMSRNEVADRFGAADEGIRNERFDPNPGEACARCPVQRACEFFQPN